MTPDEVEQAHRLTMRDVYDVVRVVVAIIVAKLLILITLI